MTTYHSLIDRAIPFSVAILPGPIGGSAVVAWVRYVVISDCVTLAAVKDVAVLSAS